MSYSKCKFVAVESRDSIIKIVLLAHQIWNEHYPSIIGQAQVDYMLKKFQSESAVIHQIKEEHYQYYLVYDCDDPIGYLSFRIADRSLFLSKIYLLANERGKGAGREMLQFIVSQATKATCQKIRLTVNKYNEKSILAYKKLGFKIVEEAIFDIGDGYFMDDFVMEKTI